MKDLFVTLAAVVILAIGLGTARNSLLEGQPTYDTIAKNPNATATQQTVAYLGLQFVNWHVEDHGLWKTAATKIGDTEITLINTPFEKKWSRLD